MDRLAGTYRCHAVSSGASHWPQSIQSCEIKYILAADLWHLRLEKSFC
jgi:hypothetical protein